MATALDPQAEKLSHIHTIPALVKYLDEELGWPVGVDDWEDAVFDWQPEELNLKPEHQVVIKSIKQLRPLVSGQPWGIFFVDFDKGRLPIVVLRRVLNGLAIKRRVMGGGHQTWHARDLLFVSSFGEAKSREIALAHFTDESDVGDLPTLRVLGWDEADTALELGYVARTLKQKLRWPAKTQSKADHDVWRTEWASAFTLKYRQVINDSRSLALALAELAKRIRGRVNAVLDLESDKGHLHQLHKAFKENLIADLSQDGFADMFAQTITYGLFTAQASRASGALVADDLAHMVPSTNPFLKELLSDFLTAAGRDRHRLKRVDFDELGINDVVATLRDVPMDAVLRSFNAAKPGDDPVIHFYEDFLKDYDDAMRVKRGVFYTPGPVVHFIVRSVDEILKSEFDIEDGLASTVTWGEMLQRKPQLKLPKFCTADTPFVQVLDPATGTGTFIVEVITRVHAHMLAKWAKHGKTTKSQWQPLWVEYVKTHLLPRLYAFELMMAPYAIAHMKIGLKLFETGYTFPEGGPRVNVFLTNSLEPPHPVQAQLEELAPMLAHEASAANHAKERVSATVIIGNPPYAGHSANNNLPGIVSAVHEYKRGYPDLQKPGQGKWLQNDYVKFIRFAELRIQEVEVGILGFITDHSYLDNPTFKGMRCHLRSSFSYVRLVDLHGNTKKVEKAEDGSKDESVFGILQGTAIGIFARGAARPSEAFLDVFGSRAAKAGAMLRISLLEEDLTALAPNEPHWLFRPQDQSARGEYEKGWGLPVIFSNNGDPAPGIVTTHDEFAISWDAETAKAKVEALLATRNEAEARELFQLCTQDQWSYKATKVALADGLWKGKIVPIQYRPFDERFTVYDKHVAVHRRERVSSHMLDLQNLALSTCRQLAALPWAHVFLTRAIQDDSYVSNRTKERTYLFPLWLGRDISNISSHFLKSVGVALLDTANAKHNAHAGNIKRPVRSADVFFYIYALLHSPSYRQRYASFLRADFPRIPIPGSHLIFEELAALGTQLTQWHLLEHPDGRVTEAQGGRGAKVPEWFGTDFELQRVAEKGRELADVSGEIGKVYVNSTSGFANVRLGVWQHVIGCYQVLHKWLDDRRKAGRSLSKASVTHWLRVYDALEATQVLMKQVDAAIEANGGWPGAFSQSHPPPDAATLAVEQAAQKEQVKAQKKASTETKQRATFARSTRTESLFDADEDLDALAAAAGEPPRPKAKATPAAKAAGGSASTPSIADLKEWQVMCAIRAVLLRDGALARADLIRTAVRELGYARTSPRISQILDNAIRRAVRRGIAENAGGQLQLAVRDIDGYARDHLKSQLIAVIRTQGGWYDKGEVPRLLARWLGFARTGKTIAATSDSLLRSLVKAGVAESMDGRVRISR